MKQASPLCDWKLGYVVGVTYGRLKFKFRKITIVLYSFFSARDDKHNFIMKEPLHLYVSQTRNFRSMTVKIHSQFKI